jgi:peptide chain release factor subunit 1
MDSHDIQRLRATIRELEAIRGRHTELVTVYAPAGYSLEKVAEQVRSEQSTAMNIKSKTVRKNVMAALEKISQHLKGYNKTPDKGLAIFCGNVSDREGVSDIELWSIEPPEDIKVRLYRCDQMFILDPLAEMVREKEIYGYIVLDQQDATIGVLRGKRLELVKNMDSIVPGKTKAGGWSANRYARIREGLLNDFLKKIGEISSQKFLELKDLKGVIIGGPGPMKEQFAEGEFLHYEIKNKVLGLVSTSYTGEHGLREAVERSEDLISEAAVMHEKRVLDRFFTELQKDSGLAAYGFREVIEALEAGNLELLIISEGFDFMKVTMKCPACCFEATKVLNKAQLDHQHCPECNQRLGVIKEHDLMEELIEKAGQMGTRVEVVSVDTQRGEQLQALGGIGGILRYRKG